MEAAPTLPVDVVPSADRDAEFSAFMASALPRLSRAAMLLTGDRHRADDLVQEALIRTYSGWARARLGNPTAYAMRAVTSVRVDTWRRLRREVLHAPGCLPERPSGDEAERRLAADALVRALRQLSRQQRQILVLRFYLGLSEKETADELGVPVGTVKSRAARAASKVRSILTSEDGTPS